MHEFAVAESIVQTVSAEANKHEGAAAVEEVYVEVGDLAFINSSQLIFAFNTLKKNTILEKARMLIANIQAIVRCGKCGYEGAMEPDKDEEYHFATPFIICPRCQGPVEVLVGRQCTVKNIRLRVEDEDAGQTDQDEEKQEG